MRPRLLTITWPVVAFLLFAAPGSCSRYKRRVDVSNERDSTYPPYLGFKPEYNKSIWHEDADLAFTKVKVDSPDIALEEIKNKAKVYSPYTGVAQKWGVSYKENILQFAPGAWPSLADSEFALIVDAMPGLSQRIFVSLGPEKDTLYLTRVQRANIDWAQLP
jgi:hypothetical protein